MLKLPNFRVARCDLCTVCEWLVLGLVVLSILWRGGKSLEMTWLLTGVAGAVTIISHATKNKLAGVPLVLWLALMAFTGVTIASYLTSTTLNYGLDEVLRTGSLSLLLLWTLRVGDTPEKGEQFISRLVRVLAATLLIACVIGVLVYVFQPVNRFVGTFFDHRFHTDYWPNAWASVWLLSWPVVLYWMLREYNFDEQSTQSRVEFLVRAMLLGFVLGCFVLSYSRGAAIAFAGQLVMWGAIVYRKTRREFPLKKIIPVTVMIGVVALGVYFGVNHLRSQWYEVQAMDDKITFQATEGSSSVTERLDFWQQAFMLGVKRPLLGWGPYSFRFVQTQYQTGVLETSDHPHNVFLKLFAERGAVAALLFLAIVSLVLYRAARLVLSHKVEVGTLTFSLRMLTFLGLLGVLAHSLIDYNLQFVGIALPFWLLLGVTLAFLEAEKMRPVPARLSKVTELILAGCLLLIALYEGAFLITSSFGRHAEAAQNNSEAIGWYEHSTSAWFSRDLHLSRAKIYSETDEYSKAQHALSDYFALNQQDQRAWKRQGDIALLNGNATEAMTAYQEAFRRGKYNDLGIVKEMINMYRASSNQAELDAFKPTVDAILNQYSAAMLVNKHHIALSPNVDAFIAICNVLARRYLDEAPRYQVMAARVDHHAQVERDRITARPPGFLW